MDWDGALRDRAGPFAEAARRFVGDEACPKGTQGIAYLRRRIDRFWDIEEPSEELEATFIEGAGSLLSLLLLERLEGHHVRANETHRLRLGRYGMFDPLGTIEAILASDDPHGELRRSLRRAEAEARDDGPVSRVFVALETALRETTFRIAAVEGTKVRLSEGLEVDLSRAIRATEDQGPAAVAQAVHRLIAVLPGGEGLVSDFASVRDRILPRLVSKTFAQDLEARLSTTALALRPLGTDVQVAFVEHETSRARYIKASELTHWALDEDALFAHAVTRLSRIERPLRYDIEDGIFMARTGDGLDSSRLLLPSLREVLQDALGGSALVAVPHRDTLLAAREAHADALSKFAEDAAARAPHRISTELFRVDDEGLRPVRL
ncbi:MAG: DUF1444 family protein [Myxococcota bacterium]